MMSLEVSTATAADGEGFLQRTAADDVPPAKAGRFGEAPADRPLAPEFPDLDEPRLGTIGAGTPGATGSCRCTRDRKD